MSKELIYEAKCKEGSLYKYRMRDWGTGAVTIECRYILDDTWSDMENVDMNEFSPDELRAIADCMEQKEDSPYLVREN